MSEKTESWLSANHGVSRSLDQSVAIRLLLCVYISSAIGKRKSPFTGLLDAL